MNHATVRRNFMIVTGPFGSGGMTGLLPADSLHHSIRARMLRLTLSVFAERLAERPAVDAEGRYGKQQFVWVQPFHDLHSPSDRFDDVPWVAALHTAPDGVAVPAPLLEGEAPDLVARQSRQPDRTAGSSPVLERGILRGEGPRGRRSPRRRRWRGAAPRRRPRSNRSLPPTARLRSVP